MFGILSQVFKYIFIVIIYVFIFSIIRMIYLDIKSLAPKEEALDAAYLKVVNRLETLDFKMKETYLLTDEVTIGRAQKNTIVIQDSFVSKNHLRIFRKNDAYLLEDLNSANGTYLNGERVSQIQALSSGDRISVGFIQFLFVDK
ncbi:MAG: FHA domain-containing protein [Tissierellia bacterium]|nr:FHA domain-containing protein [Tissierellia bacterium]